MLLDFQFDRERHLYTAPGHYVLSTSDVIDLAGLADMSQIPAETLAYASYRGTCLHKAIEQYEMGEDWKKDFNTSFQPYLDGWFAFRRDYKIQVLPPCEKQYVYRHEGTGQAIGCTIDLRFILDGCLFIGDAKSIYPVSGKALRQKKLAWRLQGQSYKEATFFDEPFFRAANCTDIASAFIHIHPRLKNGYALHLFHADDALLWDSAVRMAQAKIAAGMVPAKREKPGIFKGMLSAAVAALQEPEMDTPF